MTAAPASAKVISLSDERASIRRRLLQKHAREIGEKAFARAGAYDEDGAYPAADVTALHESGLLTAVLPVKYGGTGLLGLSLSEVLRSIGSGSLPLGRLFEGHVNAVELVASLWRPPTGRAGCGGSAGREDVRRLEHR